jgi:hypothetical protein
MNENKEFAVRQTFAFAEVYGVEIVHINGLHS